MLPTFQSGSGPTIRGLNSTDNFVITIQPNPLVVSSASYSAYTPATPGDSAYNKYTAATVNTNFKIKLSNVPLNVSPAMLNNSTAINSLDSSGKVAWISNGTTNIAVTAGWMGTQNVRQAIAQTGGNTQNIFTNFVSGSLGAACCSAIDTAISGKTAGLTSASGENWGNQDIFSQGYVRNLSLWLPSTVDLTCMNYRVAGSPGVTLISPQHIIMAHHFQASSATFVDNAGNAYTRNITNSSQIGSTDIQIGILDSALPSAIKPIQFLPSNYALYLPGWINLAACVFTDQYNHLKIGECYGLSNDALDLDEPKVVARQPWYSVPISYDSGSCVALVVGSQLVMVNALHYTTGGDYDSAYLSAINSAMTALGGSEQLTLANLAAYTLY